MASANRPHGIMQSFCPTPKKWCWYKFFNKLQFIIICTSIDLRISLLVYQNHIQFWNRSVFFDFLKLAYALLGSKYLHYRYRYWKRSIQPSLGSISTDFGISRKFDWSIFFKFNVGSQPSFHKWKNLLMKMNVPQIPENGSQPSSHKWKTF